MQVSICLVLSQLMVCLTKFSSFGYSRIFADCIKIHSQLQKFYNNHIQIGFIIFQSIYATKLNNQNLQQDYYDCSNKIMKSHKTKPNVKKETQEIAMQSQPMDLQKKEGNFLYSNKQLAQKSSVLPSGYNSNLRFQNMQNLIEKISLAEKSSKAQLERKAKQISKHKTRKIINVNLMKLQDKHFQIDKNIYNIAIGQLNNKQAYLATLNQQINSLKTKIQLLQQQEAEQDPKIINRSIDNLTLWSQKQNQQRSRTIDNRKTHCGRFYNRLATPESQRYSLKFKDKHESNFFKWRPQLQQTQNNARIKFILTQIPKDLTQTKNPQQNYNNYRLKKYVKIPSFSQQRRAPSAVQNNSKTQQFIKIQSLDEPNDQILNNQLPQQSQQSKQIFKQSQPQWQINDIADDFRDKMLKKLQIPQGFPPQPLSSLLKLTQYQNLSHALYQIFKINLKRLKQRVVVRKFKNGVYFQLPPDKNIIWYFNGTFYFGHWQTDLPTEGQKNGFGFQYIPNKYVYLGYFKNGLRHGKGVIKVFPKNSQKQSQFTGYDGDWFNGKPDGFGKHIDQNNTKYIGTFTAGQKTGEAIILTKDGLRYQGQVIKGIKNGLGLQKLVNGDVYTGQFIDGKFDGRGIYKWKNESSYQGQFVRGKRQGKGIWKSSNGDSFEGHYFNDTKHGWGQFKWANGQIYEGQFRNDVRHGQGTYKHPSGKQGKFIWKNGQIQQKVTVQKLQQSPPIQKSQQKAF